MKGYRFYLEFADAKSKRRSGKSHAGHEGNVVAVVLHDDVNIPRSWIAQGTRPSLMLEALSAVLIYPNSDVNYGGVAAEYLAERCKRIPETLARQIHPRLFSRLDS